MIQIRRYILIISIVFTCCSSGILHAQTIKANSWLTTTSESFTLIVNGIENIAKPTLEAVICSSTNEKTELCNTRVKGEYSHGALKFQVSNLSPKLWSPAYPNLYQLSLQLKDGKKLVDNYEYTIGFRDFETKKGQIYLNGNPIFLKGIAINPPGRGIPKDVEESREFAYDYVKFMKSLNVNIIRIPESEVWYNVCDELGMMVFGGNYGPTVGGQRPPENYDDGLEWYKNIKFQPIMHHPSLMIYALTNEVPYKGDMAPKWVDFLSYAHQELVKWDNSRLYIGNAGYGYGQSGDICDLHRYWGWYYSSPYTFMHVRDYDSITFPEKVQPLTFTECVGNYTGPDGRYNLTPNHKNPVSQLCWTGHAPQAEQQSLADEHQIWVFKEATELVRRLRRINSESSGIFPFTILFRNWHTAWNLMDMDPKPVTQQVRLSYQPVLISWENWQPQVYAGSQINPIAHVVNDLENCADLDNNSLVIRLLDKANSIRYCDTLPIPTIKYYDIVSKTLSIQLPENLFTGYYTLEGIVYSSGMEVSRNQEQIFIAQKSYGQQKTARGVLLYDADGTTSEALKSLSIKHETIAEFKDEILAQHDVLIIGANAADSSLSSQANYIHQWLANGGRVVILTQDAGSQKYIENIVPVTVQFPSMDIDNPAYPPPDRPSKNGFNINIERTEHPVFSGITREELKVWSDYTAWDETQQGLPQIYPVSCGFVLSDKKDIEQTAVLANYSVGLEAIALAEFFTGKGSVLLSGFDLVNRISIDPVADRLMLNVLHYMQSEKEHQTYVYIDEPIRWGEYRTEKGMLTGINSGFMINAKPKLVGSYEALWYSVDELGHGYAGAKWGWNNRAGKHYVPYGRRMFGPYYHRSFGGVGTPIDLDSDTGEASFYCRVPMATNRMNTTVWNPVEDSLRIRIRVDGKLVSKEFVDPHEYLIIPSVIQLDDNILKVELEGDRRLVILETSFDQ